MLVRPPPGLESKPASPGLDNVEAMAAARRARAVIKFASLKTWIAEIVKNQLSTRKTTWVSGTTRWLSRFTGIRSQARHIRAVAI